MSALFTGVIANWDDWGRVYQDIAAWRPLIGEIFRREGLPPAAAEPLTPGTNAVFRVGGFVVKIFAPDESGMDSASDIRTEAFALRRAAALGVCVPRCAACGVLEDRYRFAYLILEFLPGREFAAVAGTLSAAEKTAFGRRLRAITDRINTPCDPFNDIDVLHGRDRHRRWDRYPAAFRRERLEHIRARDYGGRVFVHGDLCADNILIGDDGGIALIDFADAVRAPLIYEHAHIAGELFRFEKPFLTGYFGDYSADRMAALCFEGLLIHDFGGEILEERGIARPEELTSLAELRRRLYRRVAQAAGERS